MADPIPTEALEATHDLRDAQERALVGILCRSGVHHKGLKPGGTPCWVCVQLAEFAIVAVWETAIRAAAPHLIAEGRRQAAAAIRARAEHEINLQSSWLWHELGESQLTRAAEWAARIAETPGDDRG